jgi:hypothetical protein
MTEPISLTLKWKKRLDKVNNGLYSQGSNPNFDSIDFTKSCNFTKLSQNNNSYIQRQVTWLKERMQENEGLNCRFLLKLPDGLTNNNQLRDIFLRVQTESRMPILYIFCSSDENEEIISNYIDNLDNGFRYCLVLPISMEGDVLSNLTEKYLDKNNFEVIHFYEDWIENIDNFNYIIRLAERIPERLHMAFVPVDINKYGNGKIFSTILIAKGFKSVSLTDPEFKNYFSPFVGRRIKTTVQKVNDGRWTSRDGVCYETLHPIYCNCLGIEADINRLAEQFGVNEIITFHGIKTLLEKYQLIKINPSEKQEILQTQQARVILTTLGFN